MNMKLCVLNGILLEQNNILEEAIDVHVYKETVEREIEVDDKNSEYNEKMLDKYDETVDRR